jgi:hypothetical protein
MTVSIAVERVIDAKLALDGFNKVVFIGPRGYEQSAHPTASSWTI